MLAKLTEEDSSDWMDKTKYFCLAALPGIEEKQAMWT